MKSLRKFLRKTQIKSKSGLRLGALSLAVALGTAFYPGYVNAVGISRVDGGVMESNGNTHNIYASEVRGTVGLNRFGKFDLEQNNIANMYFHTKNGTNEANNLLNFVNDKININGTVNAIKNNKIGGNLYFLSKEGLVVGKNGMINAGTLNVMTTNTHYISNTELYNDFYNIVNMKEDLNRLDDEGKIEVYGRINTVDGIRLKAGTVIIGDAQNKGFAALKSGVVNFADVVNIKTGNTTVLSGLTGEQLKATRADNGDIILGKNYESKEGFKNGAIQLRAYADTRNAFDKDYNPLATSITGNNVVKAEVQVNEGSSISAYGNVDISAETSYGKGLSGIFGTDIASANIMDLLGKAAKAEAVINVDGNVKAGVAAYDDGEASVNINAKTTNNFVSGAKTNVSKNLMQAGSKKLLDSLFKSETSIADVVYADIEADAIINVGEKADIQALNDINIKTVTKMKSSAGAKQQVEDYYLSDYEKKDKDGWKEFISKYAGQGGIAINNTTNVSKVKVAGKLTAGEVDGQKGAGDVNLKAESNTLHLTNVKVAQKKSDKEGPSGGNGIRIGFSYNSLENTTDVTVSGEVKAHDGQIAIESSGTSSITTGVSANSGDGGSMATTAIDINEVNTASSVNITGKLNADKGIDISSTNETDICTSADISATWNSKAAEAVYGEGSSAEYEGLSNMFEDIGRGEGGKGLGQYAKMLAAGIALNWNDMDVQSTISIGAGAELNVPKDATYVDENEKTQPAAINISATSSITDMNLQASGSATKGEDTEDEDTKLISAGVLVANVKNNATVNIAGKDGSKKAPIISAPVVTINAEATNDWDRVNGMWDFVNTQWGLAMDVFKDNMEVLQLLNTARAKMTAYLQDNSEENFHALMGALSNLRKIMTTQTYNNFTKLNQKVFDDTISALTDFLCLSNYASTYVGASASSDGDEEAKFALSGAVAVNNFSNKANVIVGKGAQLEATNGDVDISSKASQNLIHAAGALYEFDLKEEIKNPKKDNIIADYLHDKLPTISAFPAMWTGTEAKNLIGGNVIVTNNDSQALTVIAEGAKISGDNISISADNRLVNTNIVMAGGSASSHGITGMGSYDGGSSDSIVSVDDEAQLAADEELAVDAKNNNILTSIVGNLSASGNMGIGASLGLVNYNINTISAVADNDRDTLNGNAKLQELLRKKLSDKQKSYLGTAKSSSGRGLLSAGEKISVTAKDTGVINTLTVAGVAVGGGSDDKQGQGDAGNGGILDKLNVALAGSVSVNTIDGTTLAGIAGSDVDGKGGAAVSVSANEDKYIGAYSGAAAIKTMGANGTDKSSATLSGSVGVNNGSQAVSSTIKNAKLANIGSLDNRVVKQGTNVAVGLAYGQTAVSSGKLGVQVVGSGSGVSMKNTVSAELDEVEISTDGAVKNIAQSKDIQVAGGVSASYAKNAKVGVGASVAYLDADNTLNVKINKAKITSNSLENLAVSKTTQVGGTVTAGVMTGDGVKVGVNGAVVINTLTNTNEASITGSTISTNALRVRAYDGNLVEISADGKDTEDTNENTWLKKLKDQGYNVDAVESIDGTGSAKAEGSGNKIISAAVGISVTPAAVNIAAGVAVGVNKINNSFTATIDSSSVKAKQTAIEAKSNASLLNVGAVATITLGQNTNVGGGGNVAVNNIKNDVKAGLSNAKSFQADALTIRALDEKTIRNYAGTLNFAGGANNNATLGVSVGVNNISGDTIADVTNSKLSMAGATLIDAQSNNKINNVIITAGMSMSGDGIALSGAGTVAANNISGNTKASMKGSDLLQTQSLNGEDLTINANDNTDVESIVGNGVISLSGGNVAGAIGAGADKISFTRSTTAELVGDEANKNIIMARNLKVKAKSKQDIASYAVGVGLAASGLGAGSVNGAVSTEKNVAQTTAAVENVTGMLSNIDVDAQHSNNLKRFNLGAAASGGVYSGSLGFSVGVLNDESETRALFNKNNLVATGDISINASNNNKLSSNVNTAAIAISLGGAIGANVVVDDFTSKVSVEANDNNIGNGDYVAKSFKATASNTMEEDSQQGVGSGALVAGGVGVGIFTTNTSVTNNLANNEIFAHNITATAEESRNFKNQIVNAGLGVGAITISALLNNVGAALDDKISYVVKQDDSTGKKENATADITSVLGNLDKSMLEQDSYLTDKGMQGALGEAGLSDKDVKNDMHISRGTTSSEGVQVISTKNTLYSDGKVKLAAQATTNMDEQNYQGSLAAASINIAVSKTKVNNKVGVTVDSTTIDAINKKADSVRPDIDITSTVAGEIKNTGWQGSAAGVGINTVYTGSWINNENKVTIKNAATLVGRNLAISAQDALHNIVQTKGYSYGGVAGGALYATAQSKGQNLIEVTGSNLYAGMAADNSIFADDGVLTINAEKSNKVKATVTAGAVAAGSAKGMVATAIDGEENATDETSSVSNVSIEGSNLKAGKSITATASKLLDVESKINSVSVGIAINANGAIAHAYATGAANMLSGDGNSYVSGDKLTLAALVDKQADSEHSISADMASNNGGVVGVSVNEAMTVYNVLANTQANEALYKAKDMTIKANHNVDVFNQAKGVEVGIGVASGTMAARVTTNAKTRIDAKGAKYSDTDASANSDLGDVDISANTLVKENIYAQGDGGGILDISPVAAKIVNKLTTDTVTNILGTWKLDGSFIADALNQDDITQSVKSLKVGLVGGYGGVENYDVTQHNAKINVGSGSAPATVITTDGVQLYQAGNIVKHQADNTSSGGGLLKGSGSDLATTYDGKATRFTSSVNFDNAQLTTEGADSEQKGYTTDATESSSIKAQAFTEADLQYDNKLNAVGVLYSGVWNKSSHDITYDDAVNVKGNSKLTTKDRRQDITLAAYDKSTVKFNTIANSGGIAASAYGRTYADFVRNAKVNLEKGSMLDSAYNTYINAGADLNGISSSLNYTVNSEAYNKSLIPAGTSGKIENNMAQNNQAVIAGDVTSVHNVYLNATGGSDKVKQSSKYYTIYTGTKNDEELTTVEPGEIDTRQNTNNYVDVTGSVTAGTHNGLDIDISGGISVTPPTYDKDGKLIKEGSISYDGIKVELKKGSDWFGRDSVKAGNVEVKNALLESYVKLQNAMAGYDSKSAEYKALETEMKTIFSEMQTNGFVVESKNAAGETVAVILDSRYMPSVELSDIYVSGGNINITADKLRGDGKLIAQGVDDLKIANSSNTNLIINDVVIEESGGKVTFNGKNADANNKYGFDGSITADAATGKVPTISISSIGDADDNIKNYTNADLTILGKLQNIEGKITISNEHHNINISGEAAISAQQIEIKAEQGSVTQNSNGFFSIGSDPISRYQFSTPIANKIQKYVAELIKKNRQSEFTADSYADYCQYLINHAGDIGLTLAEQADIRSALANYQKLSNGEVANGIVAGSNVYINARNLNIDGLVQSGYDKYNVEYTDAMQSRINELDKKYSSIANKDALTDSDVLGNSEFLINYVDGKASGGATYDSAGKKYIYEIKLYYNPATREIISEKVETNGGKIYLTGAISSTGNGRLLAMNGTADVGIDLSKATGANERDLNVSGIKINDVSGLISIRDTSANKQTTYVDKGNKVERTTYDIDAHGNISNAKTELVDKSGLVYTPKAGTTISWTGGITGAQTVTTKHYEKSFVAWGLIKYGTTQDFIDKIKDDAGKISSTTTTTADGSELNSGVYIGSKGNNKDFSVDGQRYDTSKSYSSVSEDKIWDTWGKIFGYGTMKYTWKEYEGSSTSSTYTISADKNIGVGFMDGGKGNISIKNAGNLTVNGWLQNASKTMTSGSIAMTTGVGAINLTSNNGDIYAWDGARLATDNLAADAKGNVFLYGHTAIGDNAKVSLGAQTGLISFASDKGNLEMSGAGAANGSYMLQAAGDVTTAKQADGSYTADKIIGSRVDITSKGSVDVRVDTGTDMSGGFLNDGLNIDAQGDIKVYHNENNKNLLVGEIISHNGDVSMETTNSFVDAINDNTLSDADERIQHWQEMGIISADDSEASKTASAKEQKDAALADANAKLGYLAKGDTAKVTKYQNAAEGLKDAFDTYRSALKNAKTAAERTAAAEAYNTAKASYFNGKGYSSDEQSAIANYAEANFTDNYGWSADQLLYAIQKDVINSTPGQTVLGDAANITGHNITLKAGKGIGVDAAAETITADKLGELDSLKKLSQAKSGDLTWHEDGSITIAKQQPLLINVLDKEITGADGSKTISKGSVDFDAKNNVYIAGIKDTQLNINGSIDTKGDIKLMADRGITTSDKAVFSGRNLTLYGGAGNVGSQDNMFNISRISGSLNANTDREHGVYIRKSKDTTGENTKLTIEGITTGKLVLESATGMDWSQEEGKSKGYIDANIIDLTATKGSDIGAVGGALRILNNDAVISASGSNIYLQGVNEAGRVGSLTVTDLFVDKTLVFNSEGNINLAETQYPSGSIGLSKIAKRTVELNGYVSYSAAEDVTLNSTGGAITQSKYHKILADNLTATAQGDVLLEGGVKASVKYYNELQNVTLGSAGGKIVLANGGSKDLYINVITPLDAGLAESINLRNYVNGKANAMTVTGNITAKGDITITQEEDKLLAVSGKVVSNLGDVTISGANGVDTSGTSSALKALGSNDIDADNTFTADAGDVTIIAVKNNINNSANIKAKGMAILAALDGEVVNKGKTISAGGIGIVASGDINFDKAYQQNLIANAANDTHNGDTWNAISIISLNGSVNLYRDTDIQSKGDVLLKGYNDVTVGVEGTGSQGHITSDEGNTDLIAEKGDVRIGAVGGLKAAQKVSLRAEQGTIFNEGSIEGKSVSLDAYGDINTADWKSNPFGNSSSTIIATGTAADDRLDIISRNGSVTLNNDTMLLAKNDIRIYADKNLTNDMQRENNQGGLYTSGGDIWLVTNEGKLENKQLLLTDNGNVYLQSVQGDIDNNGAISAAHGNAELYAWAGSIKNNAAIEADNISLKAATKLVNSGSLTAATGVVELTATNDVANSGEAKAKTSITMKSEQGDVTNEAALTADEKVTLTAENGSVQSAGYVNAGSDVSLTAKDSVSNKGVIDAGGSVDFSADKVINIGNISAGADVDLTANSYVDNASSIIAGKALSFTADAGYINNIGKLTAHDNLQLQAQEAISSKGDLQSTAGKLSISSANSSISSNGSLTAAKDVNVSAVDDITTTEGTISGENVILASGAGSIINNNSIEAQKELNLDAYNNLTSIGGLKAEAGSASLTAQNGSLLNTGSVSAGQDISMNAALDLTNANAASDSTLNAGTNISLRAQNGSLLNEANATAVKGEITLNGLTGVTSRGNLSAQKDIDIFAFEGAVTSAGKLTSTDGDILLVAQADAALTAPAIEAKNGIVEVISSAGSVELNEDGQKGTMAAQEVFLIAEKTLTSNIDIAADAGNINLDAGEGLTNTGALTATQGDVYLTTDAGGLTNSGEITSQGNTILYSGVSALKNMGAITSGQHIYLQSLSSIANSGKLNAENDVMLDAMSELINSNIITAGGDIAFDTMDKINNSGVLTAEGEVYLDGFMGVTNQNNITSKQGGVTLISENSDIMNKAAINAQDEVTLDAGSNLVNSGNISAQDNVELASGDALTNSGNITSKAGVIELTAANGSLINVGSLDAQDNILLTAEKADIINNGISNSKANILLDAATTITNTEAITAEGILALLAQGKISNKGALTSNAGDIYILTSDSITNAANVHAANGDITFMGKNIMQEGTLLASFTDSSTGVMTLGDIDIIATDTLTNNGAVNATGAISFVGNSITNSTKGSLRAGTSLSLDASANITNEAALTADYDVSLKAGQELVNNGAIDAGDDVLLEAGAVLNNAGALAAADTISLIAGKDIINTASAIMTKGDVELRAGDAISSTSDITAGSILLDAGTNIANTGARLTADDDISLSANGSISNDAAMISEYGDIVVTAASLAQNQAVKAKFGKITMTAEDALSTSGALHGMLGVALIAGEKLTTRGSITAGWELQDEQEQKIFEYGDVVLKSLHDSVDYNGNVTGVNVTIEAAKDIIIADSTLTATGSLAEDAALNIISNQGKITLNAVEGLSAANDLIIKAQTGINNNDTIGEITAGKDVRLITATGDINNNGNIKAVKGDVMLLAEAGNIDNNADITARSITLDAHEDLNVDFWDNHTLKATGTEAGDKLELISRNGDIFIWEQTNFEAGKDIIITAKKDVRNGIFNGSDKGHDIIANNGSISIIAEDGTVYNNADIRAKENIGIYAGDDIINDGLVDAFGIGENEGNVYFQANNNILQKEILAKDRAYLISHNGSIKADKVSADKVTYVANKNTGNDEIRVKETYVGSLLNIIGNNVYLYDTTEPDSGIWQIGDNDTLYLKLSTARNTDGQYGPADNVVLDFHKLNGKLDIDKLWGKNILLNASVDELLIHKLAVAGRADISTNKMHATIYGQLPQRTDADTIFWQNYAQHNPGLSDELWSSWNDDNDNSWMNLFFHRDGVRQTSNNSVLLHKRNGYRIYNQRYSAEDWLLYRTLFDESGHRGDLTLVPLYERYNLLDYAFEPESEEAAVIKVE